MTDLWTRLEPLLPRVQKPARYVGGEEGMVRPDWAPHKVAWLLSYPDTYEIGLPNQGLQILYEILNERDDALAERAYAPWVDLEAELRAHDVPLFSVDTHRAAGEFDVVAFNLAAELVYTNLLNCLDLAGIPVRTEHRRPDDPLVAVGGHAAFNPEPVADFVDLVVLGDGEEVIGELTEVIGDWKRPASPRAAASGSCATSPPSRASTSRRSTTSPTTGHGWSRSCPGSPRFPRSSRSAPSPTWPSGPTRGARSFPSPRSCTTASTSRCSGAAPAAAGSARPG